MVRKKIDNRIRVLIENGVASGHRSMFVVVGDKAKDQVVLLHHILTKSTVKARPSVLWCYKKELGFSSNRKKRMKSLQQKIKAGKLNVNEDDPFELFIASTTIRYCYYAETHKILGNTYGMLVLQDFEALTPNLLARTVETVEGGGLVIILLRSLNSLKQLYTLSMDVHERFRTEAHGDVVARFNERFLLSLATCPRCLVLDDQLTVLPISSDTLEIKPIESKGPSSNDIELEELKEKLKDTQPVSCLLALCKTLDQGKALLQFVEAISEKTLRSTVSLTASRGRGKSAALGISIAAAVAFGYSNIFVTSPSPENLNTLFEFIFKGFDALGYQEHLDYDLLRSTNPEFGKAIVRVNVFKEHRQTIQYLAPTDSNKLSQAELVVIDEAAAIPAPLVQALLGPYLVFLASTINGYEGTGRSLSLKLLKNLRSQAVSGSGGKPSGRSLHEVTLSESIRYRPEDAVEKWLTDLLCLDACSMTPTQGTTGGYPPPDSCDLYYINRDTLFCFHRAAEGFLQRLMSLYVASHYKNSPNDLQMLSDAPAHHLFCLLGPVDPKNHSLPEIIVVIQVCLEGVISKRTVSEGLSRGKKAAGDLIPWTIAQQFQDEDFPMLSGARIVRIATHPDYQGLGYGTRALKLLEDYYKNYGNVEKEPEQISRILQDDGPVLLTEHIEPRKSVPPLLSKLSERRAEHLDYLGVSFGITYELLKFWKRVGYVPVYLRQTTNEITGEHSCIMLKEFANDDDTNRKSWLKHYWVDYRRRFAALLSFQFRNFSTSLALSILHNSIGDSINANDMARAELDIHLTTYDLKRLEMYSNNLVDYHLIMDLVPTLAKLYFLKRMGETSFSAVQSTLLVGMGLQHKSVEDIANELDLPSSQLLGLFNKTIRKCVSYLRGVVEKSVEAEFESSKKVNTGKEMRPTEQTVEEDLNEAAKKLAEQQKRELERLKEEGIAHMDQYRIKGSEEEWAKALKPSAAASIVSIKSGLKRNLNLNEASMGKKGKEGGKKKRMKTSKKIRSS